MKSKKKKSNFSSNLVCSSNSVRTKDYNKLKPLYNIKNVYKSVSDQLDNS